MSDHFHEGMRRGFLDILRARKPHADWEVVPIDGTDGGAASLADSGVDRVADLDSVGEVALAGTNPHRTDGGAE